MINHLYALHRSYKLLCRILRCPVCQLYCRSRITWWSPTCTPYIDHINRCVGYSVVLWANSTAGAESRDDQPLVRALHQGRGYGHLIHSEVCNEAQYSNYLYQIRKFWFGRLAGNLKWNWFVYALIFFFLICCSIIWIIEKRAHCLLFTFLKNIYLLYCRYRKKYVTTLLYKPIEGAA